MYVYVSMYIYMYVYIYVYMYVLGQILLHFTSIMYIEFDWIKKKIDRIEILG